MPIVQDMKVATEPAMSDVVRQRLELLLAQVPPRHVLVEESVPTPSPVAEADGDSPAQEQAVPELGRRAAELGRRAWAFGREHLAAVMIVLLVGCGWTVYSLLQARSTPVAVASPPSVVTSPTPTATPEPKLLVHVVGAVRRPGVVELAAGSRAADAIAAAGGLTKSADPAELNLAAVVADGSQIVIGTRSRPRGEVRDAGTSAGSVGGASGSGSISLNTATLEQLDSLPGVGPVTAQKILDWRAGHGRFSSVSELQEVDGIGPKTFADIAAKVRV